MRPTVIGTRVEEPVLLPGPFQLALGKSRRDSIVNRLEGGIELEASARFYTASQVDAVGSANRCRDTVASADFGRWTRWDLNPRPLPCKGSDLPLIYAPRWTGARRCVLAYLNDSSQLPSNADGLRCLLHSVNALPLDSVQQAKRKVLFCVGGDPSAGSPTDTLLRLNPPCRAQV